MDFRSLRNDHPEFIYECFSYQKDSSDLKIIFHFIQSANISFDPTLTIPGFFETGLKTDDIDNFAFNIGMIELISYYKACCSPKILIKAGFLDDKQVEFWKDIYYNGLGEFFYTNNIAVPKEELFEIEVISEKKYNVPERQLDEGCLVPVGGGKDSVVTLELLKNKTKVLPFALNPRKAITETVLNAGLEIFVSYYRTVDPALLELNKKGFLNGHTPFSALLAVISSLAAYINRKKNIALSNENSANEGNVKFSGIEINHQFSKSFRAEKLLNEYIRKYIYPDINYFSFLRPLNELKIAEIFCRYPKHLFSFRSCNRGSRNNAWCGKCSKCLFTFVILSPFISQVKLKKIFGRDMLNDAAMEDIFKELSGQKGIKPFECVGTYKEVKAAAAVTSSSLSEDELPFILKNFTADNRDRISAYIDDFRHIINSCDTENLLSEFFENILRSEL